MANISRLFQRYISFTIGLGVISAIIGGLCGSLAGTFYEIPDKSFGKFGLLSGAFYGLLVGVLYVPVLGFIFDKGISRKYFVILGGLFGIIAGELCTVLLHGTLALVSDVNSYKDFMMLVRFGSIIGIPAGYITGAIACWVYWDTYSNNSTEPKASTSSNDMKQD